MLSKDSLIECCTNNLTVETWSTLRDSTVEVDQQYCLQRCGVCHDGPFVVVDGDTARGSSYETILEDLQAPGMEEL